MRMHNIYRSALETQGLSIIYVGPNDGFADRLNTHPNIFVGTPEILNVAGIGFDFVLFNEEAHNGTAGQISTQQQIPCIFLANEKPRKKETGYLFKNRMKHIHNIICSNVDLFEDWYQPNINVFNLNDLESSYECLTKSLRTAKIAFLQNTN